MLKKWNEKAKAVTRVLPVLLLSLAPAVQADWKSVGESSDAYIYIDPLSVQREAGRARITWLLDFKYPQSEAGRRFLSQKTVSEFECRQQQERVLSFEWHDGAKGGGNVVHAVSQAEPWARFERASLDALIAREACRAAAP